MQRLRSEKKPVISNPTLRTWSMQAPGAGARGLQLTLAAALGLLCATPASAAQLACNTTNCQFQPVAWSTITTAVAGNTICFSNASFSSASWSTVFLKNLPGTSANPIKVVACGSGTETVTFKGKIQVENSQFLRITGGDTDDTYRLVIDGQQNNSADASISIIGLSSEIEIDHVEMKNSHYAGVLNEYAPINEPIPATAQDNTHIHHNYIHDVRGEGLYIGTSFYTNTTERSLTHTKIHDNIIVHCGQEGIQLGCGDVGSEIYDNYVENAGAWEDFQATCPVGGGNKASCVPQMNAYQIGQGTHGVFYGNVSVKSQMHGLIYIGYGDTFIFNNIFIDNGTFSLTDPGRPDIGGSGIFVSPRAWTSRQPAGGDFSYALAANNTIVNPWHAGLHLDDSAKTRKNDLRNNLVVKLTGTNANFTPLFNYLDDHTSPACPSTGAYADCWETSNNVTKTTVAGVKFVNPLTYAQITALPVKDRYKAVIAGYTILTTSDARDAAATITITSPDIRNLPRPQGAAYDAGAVEVCVPATTCTGGFECSTMSDGCAGTLDCGMCGTGTVCNTGTHKCDCAPKTCVGVQCGSISDGCSGATVCSTCGTGQHCDSNVCVDDPVGCTPISCPSEFTCGSVPDGCEGLVGCGTCDDDATCTDNKCVLKPEVCIPECGADARCVSNVCAPEVTTDPSTTIDMDPPAKGGEGEDTVVTPTEPTQISTAPLIEGRKSRLCSAGGTDGWLWMCIIAAMTVRSRVRARGRSNPR